MSNNTLKTEVKTKTSTIFGRDLTDTELLNQIADAYIKHKVLQVSHSTYWRPDYQCLYYSVVIIVEI